MRPFGTDADNDVPVQEQTIASHVLSFVGIAFTVMCFALFATSHWDTLPAVGRVAVGGGSSLVLLAVGWLLSARLGQAWLGASVTASGYALAYFFAYASYYVPGMSIVSHPVYSWLMQLAVAAACTAHGANCNILKWFSVPFTLGMGGHVLFQALSCMDVVEFKTLTVQVRAMASIGSVFWCAGLAALYRWQEERNGDWTKVAGLAYASGLFFRISHEVYFVLAGASALALPFFCTDWSFTPLWWALTASALLFVAWGRNQNLLKHILVAIIAAASLVSLGFVASPNSAYQVPLVVLFGVPAITTGIGLCYRFFYAQDYTGDMRLPTGFYMGYMYLTPLAVVVLSFMGFGAHVGMLVLAGYSFLLFLSALGLQDATLHAFSWLVGALAAAVYVFHFFLWTPVDVCVFAGLAYATSLIHGLFVSQNDWKRSDFLASAGLHQEIAIRAEDSEVEALVYAAAGYAIMVVGTYQLLGGPAITVAWALEALVLTVGGLVLKMMGHRVCGLLTFGACAVKLLIWDLAAAPTEFRTLAFGVAGACFLIGAFVYGRKRKPAETAAAPIAMAEQPGSTDGDAR